MPASVVFRAVTVAPGRQTAWFSFEWLPGDHPNRGPVAIIASPDSAGEVNAKLVIEDFGQCRAAQWHPQVYYEGQLSNLGQSAVGCRILAVYFPELQGDWSQ
jgi:hypothetical protein